MNLYLNRFYKRRDGIVVRLARNNPNAMYCWTSDLGDTYRADGRYDQIREHSKDLVSEYISGQEATEQVVAAPARASTTGSSKHAAIISAWANGAEVQCKGPNATEWHDILGPGKSVVQWRDDCEFRIKPTEPILKTLYIGMFENDTGIYTGPSTDMERNARRGAEILGIELLRIKKIVIDCDTREVVREEWLNT